MSHDVDLRARERNPATPDVTLPGAPVEPPPALPRGTVVTWRPPALEVDEDEVARARRALERRDRLRQRSWLRALATSAKLGVLLFLAYGLVFNFSVVRGSSMSPGIHDGDRILVDHLTYLFRDVHRGDVVVLEYPLDPSLDYIKRVIGLPGDDVRIDGEGVFVNGNRLDEPYIASPDPRSHLAMKVAPDHYFVLGDNRRHSSDSREFGLVPRENLVGVVHLRVWPLARAGLLD